MKYTEFRSSIKSGDVIAYTHKGIKSWYDFKLWVVRLALRSEYTHVAVTWCVGNRVFLLEAVGSGVRIYPLSKEIPFYHLSGLGLTEEQLSFALEYIGGEYSYLEGIKALFNKNSADHHKWQCAKYVKQVLQLDCIDTPSEVVQCMLNRGSSMKWVTL